ncbi:hypothetical protein Tco_0293907 [Tanacetum coccineum]
MMQGMTSLGSDTLAIQGNHWGMIAWIQSMVVMDYLVSITNSSDTNLSTPQPRRNARRNKMDIHHNTCVCLVLDTKSSKGFTYIVLKDMISIALIVIYAEQALDRKTTTRGKVKENSFWSTVIIKTINGGVQLDALIDGKKIIITESSVRRDLQLADEEGVDCLPNATIFEQLTLIGVKVQRLLHGMSLVVLWHLLLSA